MDSFEIRIGSRPPVTCRVEFGVELFSAAAHWLCEHVSSPGVALISDDTVAALYGEAMLARLRESNLKPTLITFPPGENHKSWNTLGAVLEKLIDANIGRDGYLVALGGGVVGDVAGLAAALHCRGIDWIQLPTTTVSMADSAVGGKTAVNIKGVKNMAGVFHQPAAIFAGLSTLSTLPERDFRAGLAEVVKTAFIIDKNLFAEMEKAPGELLDAGSNLLRLALSRSAFLKGSVVERDETEAGERVILNAGHTIAHALEAASEGSLLHGEAVAIGLALEATLATEAVGLPKKDAQRLKSLLIALGLPVDIPGQIDRGSALAFLRHDKKNRDHGIRFAMPSELGNYQPHQQDWTFSVSGERVKRLLTG